MGLKGRLIAIAVLAILFTIPQASAISCNSGDLSSTCEINTIQDITSEKVTGTGDIIVTSTGKLITSRGSGTTADIDIGGDFTVKNRIEGNFNISAQNLDVQGGVITAEGLGYSGGSAGGANGNGPGGGTGVSGDAGGAGYGGKGGDGDRSQSADGGPSYGNPTNPTELGSGGGGGAGARGGHGGGKLIFDITNEVSLGGTIRANGEDGRDDSSGSGGAGSGGTININADSITGSGTITANGGHSTSGAGGGAGGRIKVDVNTNGLSDDGRIESVGGRGRNPSETGSLRPQSFVCDTGKVTNTCRITTDIGASLNGTNLTIASIGTLRGRGSELTLNFTNVDVESGGQLFSQGGLNFQRSETINYYGTTDVSGTINNIQSKDIFVRADSTFKARRVNFTAENMVIEENAKVNTDGRGYRSDNGPGSPPSYPSNNDAGAGAGHGGRGEDSSDGTTGGSSYGDASQPTELGSGGGDSNEGGDCQDGNAIGGSGGGAVTLDITNSIVNNGEITADGEYGQNNEGEGNDCDDWRDDHNDPDAGGGSGGSIWIQANDIEGEGLVTANGGQGGHGDGDNGGDGAGGRVKIDVNSFNNWQGNVYSRSSGVGGGGTTRPGDFVCDTGNLTQTCTINQRHGIDTLTGDKLQVNSYLQARYKPIDLEFNEIHVSSSSRIKAFRNYLDLTYTNLVDSRGVIEAGNGVIDFLNLDTLYNTGTIQATGKITSQDMQWLNNTGTFRSTGSGIDLSGTNLIDNDGGSIRASGGNLIFYPLNSIYSTGTIRASQEIDARQANKIDTRGAFKSDNSKIDFSGTPTVRNQGTIDAGGTIPFSPIDKLVNADTSTISAGGDITANDANRIDMRGNLDTSGSFWAKNTNYFTQDGTIDIQRTLNITSPNKINVSGDSNAQRTHIGAPDLEITSSGSIRGDNRGYPSNSGPGSKELGGASFGGIGENATSSFLYGSTQQPFRLGSGSSGPGGGAIRLKIDNRLENQGTVSVNGRDGASGGSIHTTSTILNGTGIFRANGGSNTFDGAGGRIHLDYSDRQWQGSVQVNPGGPYAEGGTIDPSGVRCDRGNTTTECYINSRRYVTDFSGNNLTLGPSAELFSGNQKMNLDFKNVRILENQSFGGEIRSQNETEISSENLILKENSLIDVVKLNISSDTQTLDGTIDASEIELYAGNLTASSTSLIQTDGRGYTNGPGSGAHNGHGGGGGYGGIGGGRYTGEGGKPYGSAEKPDQKGSGSYFNDRGGGKTYIQADNRLTLNGDVTSNGESGQGGGSGGSIWIDADKFEGSGKLQADGGDGSSKSGGSGGRIAVHAPDKSSWDGDVFTRGGTGGDGYSGGPGTTYPDNLICDVGTTDSFCTIDQEHHVKNLNGTGTLDVQTSGMLRSYNMDMVLNFTEIEVVESGEIRVRKNAEDTTLLFRDTEDIEIQGELLVDNRIASNNIGTFNITQWVDRFGDTQNALLNSRDIDLKADSVKITGQTDTSRNTIIETTGDISVSDNLQSNNLIDLDAGNDLAFSSSANSGNQLEFHADNNLDISGTVDANNEVNLSSSSSTTISGTAGSQRIYVYGPTTDITSSGTLNTDGRGYSGGNGPGSPGGNSAGASFGGVGEPGGDGSSPVSTYGNALQPNSLGSGGGNTGGQGGSGGGAIKIVASNQLTHDGTVTSDGTNGGNNECSSHSGNRHCSSNDGDPDGGGGSGGSIWIETGTMSGTGTMNANGGRGGHGDAGDGGNGAGGRIAIESTNDQYDGTVFSKSINEKAGAGTTYPTDYLCDQGTPSSTCFVNNNHELQSFSGSGKLVVNSRIYSYNTDINLEFNEVEIKSGGSVESNQGDVNFKGTSTLINSGTITANNNVLGGTDGTLMSSVTSSGDINANDDVKFFTTGDISTSGSVNTNNVIEYNSDQIIDISGLLSTGGNINIDGGNNLEVSGRIEASGDTHIQASGTITTTRPIVTNNDVDIYSGTDISVSNEVSGTNVNVSSERNVDISGLLDASNNINISSRDKTTVSGTSKAQNTHIQSTNTEITSSGKVSGNGRGYSSGSGPEPGGGSSGAGYGGFGENNADSTYGSPLHPTKLGSGGNGPGGGAVQIITDQDITNNGQVTVDGQNGGSGGSIYTSSTGLTGSGSFSANGGDASYAGAGGRIHLESNSPKTDWSGNVYARSEGEGGPGTIRPKVYICDEGTLSDECLLNAEHDVKTLTGSGNLTLENGKIKSYMHDLNLDFANLEGDDNSEILNDETITLDQDEFVWRGNMNSGDDITINSVGHPVTLDGTIDSPKRISIESQRLDILSDTSAKAKRFFSTTENFEMNSGSEISTDGRGYSSGPGAGGVDSGGGYGGQGGGQNGGTDYGVYGSPGDMGSGGDNGNTQGGGQVRIESENLVRVDGSISSNGENGGDGGGAGGSILVNSNTFSGDGSLTADGGNGIEGGGGGGRIAVYRQNDIFDGTINAEKGSANADPGEDGTVFTTQTSEILAPISVKVQDRFGNPITDKPVTVEFVDSGLSACSFRTDVNGEISCQVLETEQYNIVSKVFSSTIEGPLKRGISVPTDVKVEENTEIKVEEIENGDPIENAEVTILSTSNEEVCKGPTDSSGKFSCALQDTNYNVEVEKSGYHDKNEFIYRPDDKTIELSEIQPFTGDSVCGQTRDINVSSDCTVSSGTYDVKSFYVQEGSTATFESDPGSDSANNFGGVKINSEGPIEIEGTINADGQGYATYTGPGAGSPDEYGDGGAGYGGNGGRGGGNNTDGGAGGSSYGIKSNATRLGSGGGSGVSGGGSVWLDSRREVDIPGGITASGQNGGYGEGGSSGGSIRLEAPQVKGDGILKVEGGDGGDHKPNDNSSLSGGGGGAGGRISVHTSRNEGAFDHRETPGSGGEGGDKMWVNKTDTDTFSATVNGTTNDEIRVRADITHNGELLKTVERVINVSNTQNTYFNPYVNLSRSKSVNVDISKSYVQKTGDSGEIEVDTTVDVTKWEITDIISISKTDGSDGSQGTYDENFLDENFNVTLTSGGVPMAAERVEVTRNGTPYVEGSGFTDQNGKFMYKVPEKDTLYDIKTDAWSGKDNKIRQNVELPFDEELDDNTVITVLDSARTPETGIDIYVTESSNGEDACQGQTNSSGMITCSLNESKSYDIATDFRSWEQKFNVEPPAEVEISNYNTLTMLLNKIRSPIDSHPENVKLTVSRGSESQPLCKGETNSIGRFACSLSTDGQYDISIKEYNSSQDERSFYPYSVVKNNIGIPRTEEIDVDNYLLDITAVGSTGVPSPLEQINVSEAQSQETACKGETDASGKIFCTLDNSKRYTIESGSGLLRRLKAPVASSTTVQQTSSQDLLNVSFVNEFGDNLKDVPFRIQIDSAGEDACAGRTNIFGKAVCGVDSTSYNLLLGEDSTPVKSGISSGSSYEIERQWDHFIDRTRVQVGNPVEFSGQIWYGANPEDGRAVTTETVEIFIDGNKVGETTTDADGQYSYLYTPDSSGTETATFKVKDKYGQEYERKITFGVIDLPNDIDIVNATLEDGGEPLYEQVSVRNLDNTTYLEGYPDENGKVGFAVFDKDTYVASSRVRTVSNIQAPANIILSPYASVEVVDINGDPVQNEDVYVNPEGTSGQANSVCIESTDQFGKAFCRLDFNKDYDVRIGSPIGTPRIKGRSPIELVTPTTGKGDLRYTVKDSSGNLLGEEEFEVSNQNGEKICRARSTSKGAFYCQPTSFNSPYNIDTAAFTGVKQSIVKGQTSVEEPQDLQPTLTAQLVDLNGRGLGGIDTEVIDESTGEKACEGRSNATGYVICTVPEQGNYTISSDGGIERTGVSPVEKTVVEVGAPSNNEFLNLSLKGPEGNYLNSTEVTIRKSGTGDLSCRGDTNSEGRFNCGLDSNNQYNIFSEGSQLLRNVEVPSDLELGRNLEVTAVNVSGQPVEGAQFEVRETFGGNDLACTGTTGEDGVFRCGLEINETYDIYSEQYGLERERVKMPEIATLQLSHNKKFLNITLRNQTDARLNDENLMIRDMDENEMCGGRTNEIGEVVCGIDPSKDYELMTDAYNSETQAVRSNVKAPSSLNIKTNANISLLNHTGTPPESDIYVRNNKTGDISCRGAVAGDNLVCSLEFGKNYSIEPYPNRTINASATVLSPPFKQSLETIAVETYNPENSDVNDPANARTNTEASITYKDRNICTGDTGGPNEKPMICGVTPERLYTIENPVKNVTDIKPNESLRIGYGETSTGDLQINAPNSLRNYGIIGENFSYPVSVENTGDNYAYDINVDVEAPGSESWIGYSGFRGGIAPGQVRNISVPVYVPEGSADDNQNVEANVSWIEPRVEETNEQVSGSIFVIATGRVSSDSVLEATVGEGETYQDIGDFKIDSVGNEPASADYVLQGLDWESGYDPLPEINIDVGYSENVTTFISVPENTLQGEYNGRIDLYDTSFERRKDDEVNLTVHVPPSIEYSREPESFGENEVAIGNSGDIGNMSVSNDGNQNLTFSINKEVSIDGSSGFVRLPADDRGFDLRPGRTKEIPLTYEIGKDESGGLYEFNLTVDCSPGCDTKKISLGLDVQDIPPEIEGFNAKPVYAEPGEEVTFSANVTDNKAVNRTWIDLIERENITADQSRFDPKQFFGNFTPEVDKATFEYRVYARDDARPDPLVTSSEIGEFFVVPDTVVGTELNESQYIIDNIEYSSGASINNLMKINNSGDDNSNPQEAKNVTYEVTLPNQEWSTSPTSENLGTLSANEAIFRNLDVDIPADTSPGTYRPLITTEWDNADGTEGSNERRFRIDVEENPKLELDEDLKAISTEHDTSESFNVTLSSTGNVFAEDISSVCAEGSACDEMFITIEEPDNLEPGDESTVNVTANVPRGTPPDTYSGTIVFRSTNAQTNMSFEVDVPKDVNYTVTPENQSTRVGTGGNIDLEEVELQNTGNQPLEISMPTNTNFIFRPTSFTLNPGDVQNSEVTFNAPSEAGQKEYEMAVGGFDSDTFEKTERYINISADVVDFEVGLENLSKSENIKGGEAIELEANASFNGEEVTENVEWSVKIGGEAASSFTSEYRESRGSWFIDTNAPELSQGFSYDLELIGEYTEEEVKNNQLIENKISYKDQKGPEFTSTIAEDVRNADALITAQVEDKGDVENVRSVNATVEHPSGVTKQINLEQGRGEWSGEVDDGFLNETGYYDVEFIANDTAGNENYRETFIQNFRNQRLQGSIKNPGGSGVETKIELMRPGTSTKVDEIKAENGEYDEIIRSGTYDVLFSVADEAFIQLNDVPSERLKDNPIDIDPNIQNQYVDVPNASAENELTGIAVNTSLQEFEGVAAINYTEYEPDLLNIRFLKLHKCEAWQFDNKAAGCGEDWEIMQTQIRPEQQVAATDIEGFSSFFMAQRIGSDAGLNDTEGSGDENLTGGGGGSGGGGSGGSDGGDTGGGGSGIEDQIDQLVDNLNESNQNQGPSADFNNQRIDAQLKPGQTYSTTIGIRNNLNSTQTFTTSVDGEVSRYLAITDSLDISPKDTGQISVFISIPENASEETYSESLVVESDEISKNIPVNLEIAPEERKLLDLIIRPVFDRINPGDTLQLETSLSNQGYSETVDVNVSVQVTDAVTEEIISKSTKTVAVSTTLDRVFEMALPEDVELGRYEVRANASYTNKDSPYVATSIQTVQIVQPFWQRETFGVKNIYLGAAAAVLLLLIAAGYFGYTYYRKKQLEKQRYDEDLDMATLPSGGPRQAFVGELAEKDTKAYYELEQLKTHALIAGATGSGKSVTGQDIVEEALEEGTTVIVLDPTAQWSGFLRECDDSDMLSHYDEFGMSKDERTGFNGNIRAISAGEEIDITPYLESDEDDDEGEIIVFTMHKMDSDHIDDFVDSTIQQIFDANLPERNELETLIVYDEVHRLLEKFGGSGKGLKQLERGAREFRKWGVGMILLSQVVADFSGEIRANIGTTIQMRTQYEEDLERIRNKFDTKTVKSIVKADIGSGMIQNSDYNHGRPYFINFRPMLHSPHRLSDEKLEKYEKYNKQINDLEARIDQKEENGEDVFELRSELQLARKNLRKGSFNLVEVYIEELENRM